MTTEPSFEFNIRAVAVDPTGYYLPRWDKAQKLTVIASTKSQAYKIAINVLGKAPRGWDWILKFDQIRQQTTAGE